MARKRMFDNDVINQDIFIDLPSDAKALYFLLGMEADDEGFITPKKVLRMHNIAEDCLKILILKGFVIPFESGVLVITDWKRNNYLDKNKIKETIYCEEKNLISFNEKTQKYTLNADIPTVKPKFNESLTEVKQKLTQYRVEENSIEENSIDNIPASEQKVPLADTAKANKHKYGKYKNVLLKDEELQTLKREFSNWNDLIEYLSYYREMKGYKAKSDYLAIRKWVVEAVKREKTKHQEEVPSWVYEMGK